MKFLKINNLAQNKSIFDTSKIYDYKTLNINLFIPNSVVYPDYENACILATDEVDFDNHSDLLELTEEEYLKLRLEIYNKNDELMKSPIEVEDATIIQDLKKQNADLTFALMSNGVI